MSAFRHSITGMVIFILIIFAYGCKQNSPIKINKVNCFDIDGESTTKDLCEYLLSGNEDHKIEYIYIRSNDVSWKYAPIHDVDKVGIFIRQDGKLFDISPLNLYCIKLDGKYAEFYKHPGSSGLEIRKNVFTSDNQIEFAQLVNKIAYDALSGNICVQLYVKKEDKLLPIINIVSRLPSNVYIVFATW